MKKQALFIITLTVLASCSTARQTQDAQAEQSSQYSDVQIEAADDSPVSSETFNKTGMTRSLPPIVIYRMNGDYANLVPVNLDESGTQLVSYPDPIDITPSQKPEPLVDGWFLDHRGVGPNTAFTTWTYEEYHSLSAVPSQKELMAHIKVRNGITEVRSLGNGFLSTDSIISYIKGLKR